MVVYGCFCKKPQYVCLYGVVAVDKPYIFAPRLRYSCISCNAQSGILLLNNPQIAIFCSIGLRNLHRPVRTAIIDDDQFVFILRNILPQTRFDAIRDVFLYVVCRNDDTKLQHLL